MPRQKELTEEQLAEFHANKKPMPDKVKDDLIKFLQKRTEMSEDVIARIRENYTYQSNYQAEHIQFKKDMERFIKVNSQRVVSEETRQKMRESQQKRRKNECVRWT